MACSGAITMCGQSFEAGFAGTFLEDQMSLAYWRWRVTRPSRSVAQRSLPVLPPKRFLARLNNTGFNTHITMKRRIFICLLFAVLCATAPAPILRNVESPLDELMDVHGGTYYDRNPELEPLREEYE